MKKRKKRKKCKDYHIYYWIRDINKKNWNIKNAAFKRTAF